MAPMNMNGRREILSKLGMGAAVLVVGSAARVAFGDSPPNVSRVAISFNKQRPLKFSNPHGFAPGEFTLVTRQTRDGLTVAALSKGTELNTVGFLGGGLHSVHVKVNSDASVELTGLDDILNKTANPCGGPSTNNGGSGNPPATHTCSTGCTDQSGTCTACPAPSSSSGGGGKS
jgi:hypothetical protein